MQARQLVISSLFALFLAGPRVQAQGVRYKDGTFIGDPAEILWGTVQVKAVIQNGKIADIQFLQMPFDRQRSVEITDYSKPLLKSEAIKSQNAKVDIVTSATITSLGFQDSLGSALAKAKE